ncbi:MAG TPA: hypothetical protein DCS91_22305, partial [Microcoleaceae bacterium UBA11344]|nr:hypothetical protein [Microcoleaceae cyanobacterium UBA11344]
GRGATVRLPLAERVAMKRQGILGLDRRGGMSKQCFCNFSFQSAQMFIVSRVPPEIRAKSA